MAQFLLVHGAWHGAWCFRGLVDQLARLGHEAVAVDLPCDTVGLVQQDYAAVVQAKRHGATLIEIDSGHSPFFTQPADLAEILTTLAATS